MVFPLVFAAFADTEGSRDRGSVSLSKTSDGETLVKETPAAKATPGASDPADQPEEIEPAEIPEQIEEPEDVEQIDEPEEIDEPEIAPEDVEEPEELDEPEIVEPEIEPEEEIAEPTEAADTGTSIFDQISALEESRFRGRKAAPGADGSALPQPTAADFAALSDDVERIVLASDEYADGTIIRNGVVLFWEDVDGTPYGYVPSLRAKMYNVQPVPSAEASGDASEPATLRGSQNQIYNSTHVAVFQPFYGYDNHFTMQYVREGDAIAKAMGNQAGCERYTVYDSTINAVALALTTCSVVIIDSHGCTDYDDGNGDYTSKANSSYICLYSDTGITSTDKNANHDGKSYYHAFCNGDGYWCVDGTAIANHMQFGNASNNFLWLATCSGMATDGLCTPLRGKGVGVVYGYSREVSFYGDYRYEEVFWDQMANGMTVKKAAKEMKDSWGVSDWYPIDFQQPAYPIFVSDKDSYPGKDSVQATQEVNSEWKLPNTPDNPDNPTPTPSPTPTPPTPPEDAEYKTSYYYTKTSSTNNANECATQTLHFLRFDWEVWVENNDWTEI